MALGSLQRVSGSLCCAQRALTHAAVGAARVTAAASRGFATDPRNTPQRWLKGEGVTREYSAKMLRRFVGGGIALGLCYWAFQSSSKEHQKASSEIPSDLPALSEPQIAKLTEFFQLLQTKRQLTPGQWAELTRLVKAGDTAGMLRTLRGMRDASEPNAEAVEAISKLIFTILVFIATGGAVLIIFFVT